jgi:class 3 adenylate cyclase
MGLHTGTAQLGGDNYAGMDVNRAARISGAGHGGQVLLSGATAAAVGDVLPDGVGLRDLGEVLLKDIERPEPVLQVDIDGLSSEFPLLRANRPGWVGQDAAVNRSRPHLPAAVPRWRLVRPAREYPRS